MIQNGQPVTVTDTGGTPRTRALAGALRRARNDQGFGTRELGQRLGIPHTIISNWENGRRIPSIEDTAALLGALGVTTHRRHEILDLARHARDTNWLALSVLGTLQQIVGVIECERTATTITNWAPLVLPGLLQTADYARTIIGKDTLPLAEVDARVAQRMDRRDVLGRRDPVHLDALIGEWALREQVGGPIVMADQLRFLLLAAQWPTVTIRVVRSGGDWHPGSPGSFLLFDFPRVPSVVYLEHHRCGVFAYDEGAIREFQAAAAAVRELAMNADDSHALIAKVLTELEKEE